MVYTRSDLREILQEGEATITFTKVDGSERVMKCTLNTDLIPEDAFPQVKLDEDGNPITPKPRKENLDVLRVYDLEKGEWRSFTIDKVTQVLAE